MIKRYNQFVKENMDLNPGFDEEEGDFSPELGDDLGYDEEEGDYINNDAPVADDEDYEEDEQMEDEEGGDIYSNKLQELAGLLGEDVQDGKIMYNGKKIIFPSETEMFHVDNKKFKTAEEVVNYLEGGSVEGGSTHMPQLPKNEVPQEEMELELQESKSYKSTRKFNKRVKK